MALSDHAEPLFVALTRPVMFLGVPYEAFGVNFFVSYFAFFLWGHADLRSFAGWESLLVFPAVHLALRAAVAYDPNILRIIMLWIDTRHIQPRRTSVLWAARWWPARNEREMVRGGL